MDFAVVLDYYGLLPEYIGSKNFKVGCPFHDENVASLSVNLQNDTFYCFGCDESGNVVDFIAALEDIGQLQAMIKYNKIMDGIIDNQQEDLFERQDTEKLRKTAKLFFKSLPKPSWDYISKHYMIDKRNFSTDILKKYNVKINQNSQYPIIIPMENNGEFIGYIQRRADSEEPKYLYNKGFEKKKNIVGNVKKGPIMVVEGVLDLMMADQLGFSNVAAILGWKSSEEQLEQLSDFATFIISALDNTPTGDDGSDILEEYFAPHYVRFQYPSTIKDIGEMCWHEFQLSLAETRKILTKG